MVDPVHTVTGHMRISDQLLNGGYMVAPDWITQAYAELLQPGSFPRDPLADARRHWRESLEPWPKKLQRRTTRVRRIVRETRETTALRIAPWLSYEPDDY